MIRWHWIGTFVLSLVISGCTSYVPHFRQEALLVLDRNRSSGAPTLLANEFASSEEAFLHADTIAREDVEKADEYFRLALMKGLLLEERLTQVKKALEEARALKAEEEHRKIAEQLKTNEMASHPPPPPPPVQEKVLEVLPVIPKKPKRESHPPQLSSHHTVKRGETLPQIAALPEVYNDSALWPLLYRANRDQIRDPHRIWPGQVLRIQRNLTRDDISEAHRFSSERPFH